MIEAVPVSEVVPSCSHVIKAVPVGEVVEVELTELVPSCSYSLFTGVSNGFHN